MHTVRATLLLAVALVLCGCGSDAPADPSGTPGAGCDGGATVSDAAGLQSALDGAAPGDVIVLADGDYAGSFTASAAGVRSRPVTLCGSRQARLVGDATDTGYTLHLDGAAYWNLQGFTVVGGQKGVVLDDASHNEIRDLAISDTGDEALHLRAGSSANLVTGTTIRRTGLHQPEYGEGIYVGTAESNWCDISDCEADRTDDNRIVGNDVADTTAEAVDIKEGTTGGELTDNTLRGGGGEVDSVVDLKGNDWTVSGNEVDSSGPDGISVHVILDGWGRDNRIEDNVFTMSEQGYAVDLVGAAQDAGNVVGCGQQVRPAGVAEVSNVECS